MNILVVGCGSIGRRHIENFKKHGIDDISCLIQIKKVKYCY